MVTYTSFLCASTSSSKMEEMEGTAVRAFSSARDSAQGGMQGVQGVGAAPRTQAALQRPPHCRGPLTQQPLADLRHLHGAAVLQDGLHHLLAHDGRHERVRGQVAQLGQRGDGLSQLQGRAGRQRGAGPVRARAGTSSMRQRLRACARAHAPAAAPPALCPSCSPSRQSAMSGWRCWPRCRSAAGARRAAGRRHCVCAHAGTSAWCACRCSVVVHAAARAALLHAGHVRRAHQAQPLLLLLLGRCWCCWRGLGCEAASACLQRGRQAGG